QGDGDAVLVAEAGTQARVDDIVPERLDLASLARGMGAPKADAGVGLRRSQGHGDLRTGVQPHTRAMDGALQGLLTYKRGELGGGRLAFARDRSMQLGHFATTSANDLETTLRKTCSSVFRSCHITFCY